MWRWNSKRPGRSRAGSSDLDEVRRADDEDEFVLVEAVHLGEQLVDHRVLDAAAGVGAAGGGERVELVEDDDRRRRLAGLVEDLPQVLFALADPLALQFRPADDRDRRADAGGHRLGEVGLAGARRAPEDHAARDQFFEPARSPRRRSRVALREHVEDFGAAAAS